MVTVAFHEDPEEFWRIAEPVFTADPVRNTVAITVLHRIRHGMRFSDEVPVLLTVRDRSELVGAAFRTPPFAMMVTAIPARFAPAVVDELLAAGHRQPGANGSLPEVEAFASAWTGRTGDGVSVVMDQRLYRLGTLTPPAGVPGEATVGTEDDLDILVEWRHRFVTEAHPGHPESLAESERYVRESLAAGNGQLLWRVDGKPVAVATVGAPLAGMSRVAPVYTPPELRGHGYGSAATAAASRWALDQGAAEVVLFTDLANPISNSIYQKIGYRPVHDAREVRFVPTGR